MGALSACGRFRTPLATAVGGSAFGRGRYSTVHPLQGRRLRRARSRLMAEPLSLLASPSLPYWRCCGAWPFALGQALRAAEGGGWRTRGRSGSSAASVVTLAETYYAEGSGLSRPIDLRAADATTPRRTARASSPTPDAGCERQPRGEPPCALPRRSQNAAVSEATRGTPSRRRRPCRSTRKGTSSACSQGWFPCRMRFRKAG